MSRPISLPTPRLLTLYSYLKKCRPEFDKKQLEKERLYKKLYPGKSYNDGLLRVLVREFTTVVEDFLMMERLRNDKQRRKRTLVSEYGERNLYQYFKQGTLEALKNGEHNLVPDVEYFKEKIELYQEFCFHPMTNNYDKKDKSLEQLMESLEVYSTMARLRFGLILKNKNTILKKKAFNDNSPKEQEPTIRKEKEYALIKLYELIDKILLTNDQTDFYELKDIFFPIIGKIRRNDCRIIYFMGLNFCARQINIGKLSFYKEQFEWYKKGIEFDLLMENNKMSDSTLNNIIISACRQNEFKWAENFLTTHEEHINEQFKEDAINYSKGTLSYHKKEFEEALIYFSRHPYSAKYQPKVRVLTTEMLFELFLTDRNYFHTLESHLESFRKYLSRNKIFAESKLAPFYNHVKTTGKLSKKIMNNESNVEIKKWLNETINSGMILSGKAWFKSILGKF